MSITGKLEAHIFTSRALRRSMRLQVYLPPYYDRFNMSYPVVYLLHPWGEDEHYWVDGLHLPDLADRLAHAGTLPPFIAVMPQGDKSFFIDAADPGDDFSMLIRLDPEHYAGALEGYGNYGEHILYDVLNFVERRFRVRTDRAGRVIAGVGMGGLGAAVLAFRQPGVFGTVGIHSPELFGAWRSGPPWIFGLGDETAFAARDPIALAGSLPADAGLRIYLDCGENDPGAEAVDLLHRTLSERGIPHTGLIQAGGADPAYGQAHLAEYLGFYTGGW